MDTLLTLTLTVFSLLVLSLPVAFLAGVLPEALSPATINEFAVMTLVCTFGGFANLFYALANGRNW